MYIYVLYISIYLQRYISPHIYRDIFIDIWGFPGASVVRNPPSNAGDTSAIPESGKSLEKEMASHYNILAQETTWTKEPGGPQSMGSQELDTTKATEHAPFIYL